MDFSKFDKAMDIEGLKKDVEEAQNSSGSYEEVPKGTYEVRVEKMELTESKKGDPMFTCWFKIVSESHKNSLIFMNQVITKGFQIHIVNELMRSMDTGHDVHFDTFEQYSGLIFDVFEKIKAEHLEFALDYGENKGFPTFKITEVFEGAPF